MSDVAFLPVSPVGAVSEMPGAVVARPAAGSGGPAGPARPAVTEQQLQRVFSVSILLSAFRCLLSYIILPIVTPLLGAATSVGPALGIPVGITALVFDVVAIRRFWVARHRWRWAMTAVYIAVMGMVTALLVGDIAHFAG